MTGGSQLSLVLVMVCYYCVFLPRDAMEQCNYEKTEPNLSMEINVNTKMTCYYFYLGSLFYICACFILFSF